MRKLAAKLTRRQRPHLNLRVTEWASRAERPPSECTEPREPPSRTPSMTAVGYVRPERAVPAVGLNGSGGAVLAPDGLASSAAELVVAVGTD